MSVYVDPNFEWPKTKKWPYGSVSHMYADTEEELHKLAKKIGLKREWCSDKTQPSSALLHYDLNPTRRIAAVKAGAQEVDHTHAEPYKVRRYKCWPPFVEWCKKEGFEEPTTLNSYEWWEEFTAFKYGWLAGFKYHKEMTDE